MKFVTNKKVSNLRKARNADILRRMENDESLSSFNSQSSWFPPRPTIEKDPGAIRQLYGTGVDRRLEHQEDATEEESYQKPLRLA